MRDAQIVFNTIAMIAKWAPILAVHIVLLLVLFRMGKTAWAGADDKNGTSNAAILIGFATLLWVFGR